MNVIHLTKFQKRSMPFTNPLLDAVEKIDENDIPALLESAQGGSRDARNKLITGNLGIVKALVGRFLYHWPESRRFEDDMVGAGAEALLDVVDTFSGEAKYLRPTMVVSAKRKIEVLLNNMRSDIYASIQTNYRRVSMGLEPEYVYAKSIDNALPPSRLNEAIEYVDVLDSLERYQEADSEELVEGVLSALEKYYNLTENDLTDADLNLIYRLSKVGGRSV